MSFKNFKILTRVLPVMILVLASVRTIAQQKIWTLKDCLDYALQNNVNIQKAKFDKNTAELNYNQAKSDFLPSVSGSLSHSFANGSSIDPITSNFVNQAVNSSSVGISSSINLYQGGLLKNQKIKNEFQLQQSDLYIAEAENNIRLSIAEAYIQTLYYKEAIAIAETVVASSKQELDQANIKYKNGAIARKELADLESQYASNQYNVVSSKNTFNLQLLALKQLLELDPETDFMIEIPQTIDNSYLIPEKNEIYNKAVGTLPDLQIYDLNDKVLEKEIDIAKAGYLPTLSLSAGVNTGYTSTQDFNFTRQLNGNLSEQLLLSLNIPIFSKFQNKTNVALAKINIEQNNLDKISVSKDLYQKIETAWQNAVANQEQLHASSIARDAAKLAYDLSGKKFEFGGLTTTELLISENTYLSAEREYLQVKYMGKLYEMLLAFYQGNELSLN